VAYHITITDSSGHPVVLPLWQLPMLIKEDVDAKHAEVQAVKDREVVRLQAEETARQQQEAYQAKLADAVQNPVDIMGLGQP
jgi:hypothetical protein